MRKENRYGVKMQFKLYLLNLKVFWLLPKSAENDQLTISAFVWPKKPCPNTDTTKTLIKNEQSKANDDSIK